MRGVILAGALACWSAGASAQAVELCEVEWLDAARVRALLIVEQPAATALRVSECDADGARLEVEFESGHLREQRLEFSDTDTDARSRLVGLVLVELARLGDLPEEISSGAEAARVEAGDALGQPEATRAEPVVAVVDPPSTAASPAGDASPNEVSAPRAPITPEPQRVSVDEFESSPALREWRVGLGGGLAMHRLERAPTALPQMRLRAQWTRLLVGARVSGRRDMQSSELGMFRLASFSAFAGAEVVAWQLATRWRFSAAAQLEAGAIRSDGRVECPSCLAVPATKRPLFGGSLSARLEFVGRLFGALELEAGYARGVILVDSVAQAAQGVGGLSIAVALELAVGGSANAN